MGVMRGEPRPQQIETPPAALEPGDPLDPLDTSRTSVGKISRSRACRKREGEGLSEPSDACTGTTDIVNDH